MENKKLFLKDSVALSDKIAGGQAGLFKKTQILIGHDRYVDERGVSQLGEVLFETHNMVPIGGVQYAMEKIFGIEGPINTSYLNDTHGIGCQTKHASVIPGTQYPVGHAVCLFGIGTGGAAENNSTVLDVTYREREIVDMVPFRYTNEELPASDLNKYYGIKEVSGVKAYFLKRFDATPTIKHLWKDGEEGEDGTVVDDSVFQSGRPEEIESFTEILLTISKKDVKQWFIAQGGIENARVNSIALFTGYFNEGEEDYEKIKLFSKLNIPTEPLSLAKDLNIIYRLFGA